MHIDVQYFHSMPKLCMGNLGSASDQSDPFTPSNCRQLRLVSNNAIQNAMSPHLAMTLGAKRGLLASFCACSGAGTG